MRALSALGYFYFEEESGVQRPISHPIASPPTPPSCGAAARAFTISEA